MTRSGRIWACAASFPTWPPTWRSRYNMELTKWEQLAPQKNKRFSQTYPFLSFCIVTCLELSGALQCTHDQSQGGSHNFNSHSVVLLHAVPSQVTLPFSFFSYCRKYPTHPKEGKRGTNYWLYFPNSHFIAILPFFFFPIITLHFHSFFFLIHRPPKQSQVTAPPCSSFPSPSPPTPLRMKKKKKKNITASP